MPYPVERTQLAGQEVTSATAASITPGVTTRQELVAKLGPPGEDWRDENMVVYQWKTLDPHWRMFDFAPLLFGAAQVVFVAGAIGTGNMDELDGDEFRNPDHLPATSTYPIASPDATVHSLMVAFDDADHVSKISILSAKDGRAASPEHWARDVIDARIESLTAGRSTRKEVRAILGAAHHPLADQGVDLYEWPRAGTLLLLQYDAQERLSVKRPIHASGPDWDDLAFALRKEALTARKSMRDDVRSVFGMPFRETTDGRAETYEVGQQHSQVHVAYDADGTLASLRMGGSDAELHAAAGTWRIVRDAGEVAVLARVRLRVDGRSEAAFASRDDDRARIFLFLDPASPGPKLSPDKLRLRWCQPADYRDGWVLFLVPPGQYELRAASSDLRDPVTSSLSSVSRWAMEVPVGASAIFAGTLAIEARESKPGVGRPAFLYDLKTEVSAEGQSDAQKAATTCDAGWVIDRTVPLRLHSGR